VKKAAGPVLLEYHREFGYLLDLYGLRSIGSIEEKPGVPPSAGRMAEIGSKAKASGVKLILATDYNPRKTVERVAEISGAKPLIVPSSVQPDGAFKDYLQLHEHIVDAIASSLGKGS
jgi:zinc/manganese transport system substrate-binding protein